MAVRADDDERDVDRLRVLLRLLAYGTCCHRDAVAGTDNDASLPRRAAASAAALSLRIAIICRAAGSRGAPSARAALSGMATRVAACNGGGDEDEDGFGTAADTVSASWRAAEEEAMRSLGIGAGCLGCGDDFWFGDASLEGSATCVGGVFDSLFGLFLSR
jgi:hypothetical protein